MKKTFSLFLVVITAICSLIIFNSSASADVNYDITNVDVSARVNSNGSLTMERRISYDFDDDAHGVFYEQNLNSNQEVKKLQIRVLSGDRSQRVVQSNSHQNNTYEVSHSEHGYRFKVWHSIKDGEKFTVIYTYDITNAIINWKDTAELNFKIIGNGWDTDLHNVRAEVIFPGPVKGLKAWAHGNLSGRINVNAQKGNIVMTASNINGDEGIEVHSIFPTSVTAQNKNIRHQNHKKYVLDQEARLAREANEKRQRSKIISVVILIFSALFSILVIIKNLLLKKVGVKPKKEKQLPRNYDIPSISPVTAEILDKGDYPSSQAVTAYLMELIVQKKLEIESFKKKGKTYYQIFIKDKAILKNNELLEYLFEYVGDGKSFTTYALKKHQSSKLEKKFTHWQNQEMDQVFSAGLIDKKIKDKKLVNFVVNIFLLILSIIGIVIMFFINRENWILMILVIVLIILAVLSAIYGSRKLSFYTAKGAKETNKVRSFKKMLDEIGNFKMREIGELPLWEQIMPYAVALGVSKKVLKQLKLEFAKEVDDTNLLFWGTFYSSGEDGFANNFSSTFNEGYLNPGKSDSSTSGGSGGFSGGSSGGFGGGSGGGAF